MKKLEKLETGFYEHCTGILYFVNPDGSSVKYLHYFKAKIEADFLCINRPALRKIEDIDAYLTNLRKEYESKVEFIKHHQMSLKQSAQSPLSARLSKFDIDFDFKMKYMVMENLSDSRIL